METLNIPATRNTPAIAYRPDQTRFYVSGRSIPENASGFYKPVIEWLSENVATMDPRSTFEFNLTYFNSSSLKAIYLLLMEIKRGMELGKVFDVVWYVEEDDEFMIDAAMTFQELTAMEIRMHHGLIQQ